MAVEHKLPWNVDDLRQRSEHGRRRVSVSESQLLRWNADASMQASAEDRRHSESDGSNQPSKHGRRRSSVGDSLL